MTGSLTPSSADRRAHQHWCTHRPPQHRAIRSQTGSSPPPTSSAKRRRPQGPAAAPRSRSARALTPTPTSACMPGREEAPTPAHRHPCLPTLLDRKKGEWARDSW